MVWIYRWWNISSPRFYFSSDLNHIDLYGPVTEFWYNYLALCLHSGLATIPLSMLCSPINIHRGIIVRWNDKIYIVNGSLPGYIRQHLPCFVKNNKQFKLKTSLVLSLYLITWSIINITDPVKITPTTSEWSTLLLPTKVCFILKVWR